MDVLEEICAAIPRPCSFYSAIAVWDAIAWYPDSNLTPALRYVQCGNGLEDFGPGEWAGQHDFYECCVGYQSNCLLLSYEFNTGPELEIRIELTDQHPMDEALAVVECFARRLGKPVKQCVRAVWPWEMRTEFADRLAYMRPRLDRWRKIGMAELADIYRRAQENPPENPVSPKTLAKRFVKHSLNNLKDIYKYEKPYENVVLTGLVALYEICFEQAWKAMKELLEENGAPEGKTGSPKMIIKSGFQMGMVKDEKLWLEALQARNNVAYAYNQAVALDIVDAVKEKFYPMFCSLRDEMDENWR